MVASATKKKKSSSKTRKQWNIGLSEHERLMVEAISANIQASVGSFASRVDTMANAVRCAIAGEYHRLVEAGKVSKAMATKVSESA